MLASPDRVERARDPAQGPQELGHAAAGLAVVGLLLNALHVAQALQHGVAMLSRGDLVGGREAERLVGEDQGIQVTADVSDQSQSFDRPAELAAVAGEVDEELPPGVDRECSAAPTSWAASAMTSVGPRPRAHERRRARVRQVEHERQGAHRPGRSGLCRRDGPGEVEKSMTRDGLLLSVVESSKSSAVRPAIGLPSLPMTLTGISMTVTPVLSWTTEGAGGFSCAAASARTAASSEAAAETRDARRPRGPPSLRLPARALTPPPFPAAEAAAAGPMSTTFHPRCAPRRRRRRPGRRRRRSRTG